MFNLDSLGFLGSKTKRPSSPSSPHMLGRENSVCSIFCASTAQMGRKWDTTGLGLKVFVFLGTPGGLWVTGASWKSSFHTESLISTAGRAAWQDPSTPRGFGVQQGSLQAAGAE